MSTTTQTLEQQLLAIMEAQGLCTLSLTVSRNEVYQGQPFYVFAHGDGFVASGANSTTIKGAIQNAVASLNAQRINALLPEELAPGEGLEELSQ